MDTNTILIENWGFTPEEVSAKQFQIKKLYNNILKTIHLLYNTNNDKRNPLIPNPNSNFK